MARAQANLFAPDPQADLRGGKQCSPRSGQISTASAGALNAS